VNPTVYATKIVGTFVVSNLVAFTFYKVRMRAAVSSLDAPLRIESEN
jgi:hypothetical protein